jgi:hypothetical protein
MDVAAGVTIRAGKTEKKGPNIYKDPGRTRKEFMVCSAHCDFGVLRECCCDANATSVLCLLNFTF